MVRLKLFGRAPRMRADNGSYLLVEQGNVLVIRRLGDRLQIGVDIREVVVGQDRLRIGRHGAIGGAHESGERLDRDGIWRELGPGDTALGLHAVTLPTAVLDIGRLAFLGRGSERAATAQEPAYEQSGGERRLPEITNQTHRRPP